MKVTRNGGATSKGPADAFTGTVYIDTVSAPSDGSPVNASSVHFSPGARTAWHRHPNGQTIFVTEGLGLVQQRGAKPQLVRPGDRVFFEPGEDHWHGASADRFMTHLSIVQADDKGNTALWGAHVTDEEYGALAPGSEA